MTEDGVRRVTLALLSKRAFGATVCPSEVARALAGASGGEGAPEDWRRMMPTVHAAIDRLLAERIVELSWKGRVFEARAGPYRIGHPNLDRRIEPD